MNKITYNKKVWVVICRQTKKGLLYLALKPTPGPDYAYDFYVVTGGVEGNESITDAATREVKEETNLDIIELIDLKYQLEFDDRWGHNIEHCFGALVDCGDIVLNEEHISYEWMPKDEFIKKIWWVYDRVELIEIIGKIKL